ncbi:PREDICTED: tumor protein p53-inducible nuclear protein 1 [Cyprinodon variegatus]|uniref:Tumor protein p53 inducible nuclear protein 1 n=1 Tax=Cyprinodon variegatus TaxID=28743 RepID=A0A3Q2G3H6_CYPVA|nr:PREDICTED: tumor protein p53-inducible nuclear protein 1 [Cyprinodon variegatus]
MIHDHTLLKHFSTFLEPLPAVNPAADDQKDRSLSPPSPRATLRPQPHAPSGRPGMFQRFASTLFGDTDDALSRRSQSGDSKEEEEEDWILVNYLTEACSGRCGDSLSGSTVGPHEDEEEEEEDLVMIPSPMASPAIRYPSCTSLNSTADTDLDGGAEDEEDEEEEGGFLRVDARSLEESWFVTPPPCFTGHSGQPVLLETSPLENLLIEHPSMSVYAHRSPQRLDPDMDFLSSSASANQTAAGGKEKTRPILDGPRHRPEAAAVQRRSSLHSTCYAAALSAHAGVLQQRPGNVAQRTQVLSRKALRRLNLLRAAKGSTLHLHLHQPTQRHLNF